VRDRYEGNDQVHTANSSGMTISNIGHAALHTAIKKLFLKNILHVPSSHKSLASVHSLASDDNIFFEFHLNFFLIKDRATKTVLHQGRCEGGLYPLGLNSSEASSRKLAFGVNKHSRLGHPSLPIVRHVLKKNNLSFLDDNSNDSVCDSCQRAKSHQLPYYKSNNASSSPLKLTF
jgi:hypothetical protein